LNHDYLPLIVLVVLIPSIISPITVEGISIKNEEPNQLIQFKSPMNVIQWKNIFSADVLSIIKDESQKNVSESEPYFTVTQFFENTVNTLENIFKDFTIQQAQGQISKPVDSVHQKIVMTFDSPLTEKELRDIIDIQIVPLIQAGLNTKFIDITQKAFDNEYKLAITDAGHYEFYPDFNISGETSLTDELLTTQLDDSTTDIQNTLTASTDLLKATNIEFDVNKSTGTIKTEPVVTSTSALPQSAKIPPNAQNNRNYR